MRYLFTFGNTTSAFQAEKALKPFGGKVVSVPFAISKTCYGLGVEFDGDSIDAIETLKGESIDWKRLWEKKFSDEYDLRGENKDA